MCYQTISWFKIASWNIPYKHNMQNGEKFYIYRNISPQMHSECKYAMHVGAAIRRSREHKWITINELGRGKKEAIQIIVVIEIAWLIGYSPGELNVKNWL